MHRVSDLHNGIFPTKKTKVVGKSVVIELKAFKF
jgi:hypothetical protein